MALAGRPILVLFCILVILFCGLSTTSAPTPPAKIFNRFFSNSLTKLMQWFWSLKATTKTAISGRSMMKFESGYTVETVFDGSKLGIQPYSVAVLPNGELLILDSVNSNLYRISSSLSKSVTAMSFTCISAFRFFSYRNSTPESLIGNAAALIILSDSRPRLVAGSAEGYSGHVDGKHREAKLNRPRGIAVDDRGNIYVADTANMAIRKISDAGVTTIAGGKWSRGGSHIDGPSDEAKFSDNYDVVYIGSSCSLLVIDRGNRAMREIQLHYDDCAYQYDSGFPPGLVLLLVAGFFGYMLGLLQRRTGNMVSSEVGPGATKTSISPSPYQKPPKSVRPPLISNEVDTEKQDEGFFGSLGKLFINAVTYAAEIAGSIFPELRRKSVTYQYQTLAQYQQAQMHPNSWSSQESIEVPKEDEPPSIETRTPAPRKTYAFMSKEAEKVQHQLRHSRVFSSGWDGGLMQQQQQQQQQRRQHLHQQHSSAPQTYYEPNCEKTNEIVFGAVQEQLGRREPIIRPTAFADSSYNHQYFRFRLGYNQDY